MQVQVEDGLASAAAGVDYRAVAALQFSFSRDLRGYHGHGSEHSFVFRARFCQRRKMLLGTNQNMRGRLRINVLEGKNVGVFIHHFGGNLFSCDFAEQAICAHGSPSGSGSSIRMTSVVWNPSRAFNSSANFWAFCSPEILPARTR